MKIKSPAFLIGSIIVITLLFRLLRTALWPELPNFSPLMALAFCAGLFLSLRSGILLAVLPLLLSDFFLNIHYGVTIFGAGEALRLLSYSLAFALGYYFQKKSWNTGELVTATLSNAFLFYLITNTGAWFSSPAYTKNLSGWLQALTVGLPGFPPTWTFFRNSLLSDILFTLLILGVYFAVTNRNKQSAKLSSSH
ncbi:MAG: DUF6580 family putative transport protein [Chthoniobacterales bacterium]